MIDTFNTCNTDTQKKKGKFCRILIIVLACIIGLLAISTVVNLILCKTEEKSIGSYGTMIEVDGGEMCVEIYGEGQNVIVLLPGHGDPSPVVDFKQLSRLLAAEDCTVVVPEQFGYGLSDITDKERNFENIATEIHQCLSKLGYTSYSLMGHSISGITILQYANLFPDEVKAVIAMDTSVPKQNDAEKNFHAINSLAYDGMSFARFTGLTRLYGIFDPSYMGFITDSTDTEDAEIFRHIICSTYCNCNVKDELQSFFKYDGPRMYDMKYPDNIPVLTFLSEDSVIDLDEWKPWHEELSENVASEILILDGNHYVYVNHPDEIASETIQFIRSAEQAIIS